MATNGLVRWTALLVFCLSCGLGASPGPAPIQAPPEPPPCPLSGAVASSGERAGFFKQIGARRYQGLALEVYSVQGGRHASSQGEAFTRALRFIAEPLLPPAGKK